MHEIQTNLCITKCFANDWLPGLLQISEPNGNSHALKFSNELQIIILLARTSNNI